MCRGTRPYLMLISGQTLTMHLMSEPISCTAVQRGYLSSQPSPTTEILSNHMTKPRSPTGHLYPEPLIPARPR